MSRANVELPRLQVQCSKDGRRRRMAGLQVQADMRGVMDSVVTYGAISLSLGATMYTVFYDWRKGVLKQPRQAAIMSHPDDNFTWGVMGVVSCIPLFNFMAWVLGALQSDSPRPYYWVAALYALPLFRNGFDQDWFSVAMLLLGAAQVQALRIAATEPETQAQLQQRLQPLAVVKTLANTAGTAVGAAVGTGSSRRQRQQQLGQGDSSNNISNVLGGKDSNEQDQEEVLRQLELEEFDRRLNNKSGRRN